MSVYAFEGLPGSGKSYGVTKHAIIPALKNNRKILTNIPLKMDNISNIYPNCKELITFIDSDDIRENPELLCEAPNGALIIIDEFADLFGSDYSQRKASTKFFQFWSKHRHNLDENGISQDIIIVTQDLSMIAGWIKKWIKKTTRSVELDDLGLGGKMFKVVFYDRCPSGSNPIPLSVKTEKFDKTIFEYYESHTQKTESSDPIAIQGSQIKNRTNIFKSPFFMFVLPLCLIGGIYSIYHISTKGIVGEKKKAKVMEEKKAIKEKTTTETSSLSLPIFNNRKQEKDVVRDYKYLGEVKQDFTRDGIFDPRDYAIVSRSDGSIIWIDFVKYCTRTKNSTVRCTYSGKTYTDDLEDE